jgi:hypothetical protein
MERQGGGVVNSTGKVFRMSKMARVSKLIRLFRLIKLVKVMKHKDKISHLARKQLGINSSTERLVVVATIFLGCSHLFACGWILVGDGQIEPSGWMTKLH